MKSDPYEFDSQTKFKDEPRKRHGLPWETRELAELKRLYMLGIPLQCICDLMERPKEGVLPKLANLGLITKQSNGFFWVWKRKVLPDAWKVDYEAARKEEKVRRYTEAYGGNPAKMQPDAFKTYPYLATFVGDLENAVFEGAVSGVATSADLSGLELRACTTGRITSFQPSLQTISKLKFCKEDTFSITPKEPIMKFETRTFINDVEASTYTDDQIFGEIRKAEKRIEEMKSIKTPTKKLAAAIEQLEDYASKLAAYVDAR